MSITTVQRAAASAMQVAQGASSSPATSSDSGSFAASLVSAQNETGYSDQEVKDFFARNPSKQQIADKAVALGLNENQIAQAMKIGGAKGSVNELKTAIENFVGASQSGYAWGANGALISTRSSQSQGVAATGNASGLTPAQMVQAEVAAKGMNMNQVTPPVLESMYIDAARALGVDIGPQGAWNSYYSPTLGRAVNSSEIQAFFAAKPSQAQIFQKAADLGLGVSALTNMMNGQGIAQTDATYGTLNNKMQTSLYQGRDGFSLDQYGHIVAGGGHQLVNNADGSSSWIAVASGTTVNTSA